MFSIQKQNKVRRISLVMSTSFFFLLLPYLQSCILFPEDEKTDIEYVLSELGATKYINNCDYEHNAFTPHVDIASTNASLELTVDSEEKYQGVASFRLHYSFSRNNTKGKGERVYIRQVWYDKKRSDLSFHPLAISMWIKSLTGNNDIFSVKLLQQDETFSLTNEKLKEFIYSDSILLNQDGWQQLIIPYERFNPDTKNPEEKLNLKRVCGLQLELANGDLKAKDQIIYIDGIQQLTSFKPASKNPMSFSSIFIQPHTPTHDHVDWLSTFEAYREVRIDSVIIQWAARVNRNEPITFYSNSKLAWKVYENEIIDQIFTAAEETGMQIVLGLNHFSWPEDKGDLHKYHTIFEGNKEVFDELFEKFGQSPSLAGWYLSEEFHDGAWRGWLKDSNRMLLAEHLNRLSTYIKSKDKRSVICIAPALWRGRPTDMTYSFYKSIFEKTPNIDILYLQDCGGRCKVDEDDYDVYLPQFFEAIKRACDETGVQFGVDVESFNGCQDKETLPHREWARSWQELKPQLDMASLFTQNITQFSWATFRPGVGAFDDYKEYLRKYQLLRNQN